MRTYDRAGGEVFAAALHAARHLGLQVDLASPGSGHLLVREDRGIEIPTRLSPCITDTGRGATAVVVSWDGARARRRRDDRGASWGNRLVAVLEGTLRRVRPAGAGAGP